MKATLNLDLGTKTGYCLFGRDGESVIELHGTQNFKEDRFSGGGMRYLRFRRWLSEVHAAQPISAVYYEEVRRHLGVDAAHAYGGFLAHLTAWCEENSVAYQGVPVSQIKTHATGRGNAKKEAVIAAMEALGYRVIDDNHADAIALSLYTRTNCA